jgi:hypothetical protein
MTTFSLSVANSKPRKKSKDQHHNRCSIKGNAFPMQLQVNRICPITAALNSVELRNERVPSGICTSSQENTTVAGVRSFSPSEGEGQDEGEKDTIPGPNAPALRPNCRIVDIIE